MDSAEPGSDMADIPFASRSTPLTCSRNLAGLRDRYGTMLADAIPL
ncbi:hypothetical protein [Candidatus Poriferisodalis sp.]